MSVTVFTYPSDFKPDVLVKETQQHFESHGFNTARMIGGSKSIYRKEHPKDLIIFNANVFMKDIGKVWYGDLNLTQDYIILKSIAESLDTTLYVLWEMDARFGKEKKSIDELIKKSAWNTDEVKPTKDWYLSVKMKEKK
jgi:hypothetical protein